MTKFRIFTVVAALILATVAGLAWAQSPGTATQDETRATSTQGSMMGQHGAMMGQQGTGMGNSGMMGNAGTMGDHEQMAGHHQAMIEQMQQMNDRLDALVASMDQAKGNHKLDAIADVVRELVAQRTAANRAMGSMQPALMMQMMDDMPMGGMHGSMHSGSMQHGSRQHGSMQHGNMGGSMHGAGSATPHAVH